MQRIENDADVFSCDKTPGLQKYACRRVIAFSTLHLSKLKKRV